MDNLKQGKGTADHLMLRSDWLPLHPSDNPYSDEMLKARCKDNDISCGAAVLDNIKV